VPDVSGILPTMDEKIIKSFLILFKEATPINYVEPPPFKVIHCEDSTRSSCPLEDSNVRRGLHLPNTFPRKRSMLT
jgi:hypothetical protein